MNIGKLAFGFGSAIVLTLGGCAGADKATPQPVARASTGQAPAGETPAHAAAAQPVNGWYLQGASGSRLQPCGKSQQWPIGAKADLEARAKAFDLQDDTPVYVKLLARVDESSSPRVDVVKVEQFGSPTPVRDCGMTGVVMPAAGG